MAASAPSHRQNAQDRVDIKRIYAKHRQQKGDSGPFRHPPQLLGLHGLLHEGFLLLCGCGVY